MKPAAPRIGFAANRRIGLQSLQLLLEHGIEPAALLLPAAPIKDESVALMRRQLPHAATFLGKDFRASDSVAALKSLRLDYLLSVHFPYIIPRQVLALPSVGVLNLHPALLPFNRGWHTPSWAILEQTPYGATLHWVDEGVDTGDIALQRAVKVLPNDTADSLYARVLAAELDLLRAAIPSIKSHRLPRRPQIGRGTVHCKADLDAVRRLSAKRSTSPGETLRIVRALTTNRDDEAAWFEHHGRRYTVQISTGPMHSVAHRAAA